MIEVALSPVPVTLDEVDDRLAAYVSAVVAAFPARQLVQKALQLVARRAGDEKAARPFQLLALRRYLRIGAPRPKERWSWTDLEIAERRKQEPARTLYAEAEKVREAFAKANPGYSLGISPVRSLEKQARLWVDNPTVKVAAPRLLGDAQAELSKRTYGREVTSASVASFREYLLRVHVSPEPSSAAPGPSDHGRGTAVDFIVLKGGKEIAGTHSYEVESTWKAGGWEARLTEACQATRLRGPLRVPYEPWHWVLGEEG